MAVAVVGVCEAGEDGDRGRGMEVEAMTYLDCAGLSFPFMSFGL